MLSAEHLTVYTTNGKQRRYLLKDINLHLNPGELTIILGANGAGKSTLLKALSGGLSMQGALTLKGSIKLNNRCLTRWPAKQLARQRAVMPQQVHLDFPFKVHEVIHMGRSPYGLCHQTKPIAQQASELMDVAHLQQRLYPSLSGGEQQRVQLARVLTQVWPDPHQKQQKALFLDECTSALDPAHQHRVLKVIKEFTGQSLMSCAVMHDLNLAAQYADRVLLMKDGKIIGEGTPEAVLTSTNLENTYQLRAKVINDPQLHAPVIVGLGSSL